MIYYYRPIMQQVPQIRITSNSIELLIKVNLWFPNTKAKLNQLLKLMNKYDTNNKLQYILPLLQEDLKTAAIFIDRPVKSTKMFCKMLNSNIEQIRIFGGSYDSNH